MYFSVRKAGLQATSTAEMPALAVRVHTAWPQDTPSAVNRPPRRPPPAVLLTVTAVSGPGVTMTRADTPRKARSEAVTRPI